MNSIKDFSAVKIRLEIQAQLPDGEGQDPLHQEFEFIYGVEHQPATLENELQGAGPGHRFSLSIPPEELYGVHDPALVREIPKEGLIKQRVREGEYYRQIRMGVLVEFKVLEIRADTVLVDFNGPKAGVSALMEGEVLGVREASEDEISKARERERKKAIGCG